MRKDSSRRDRDPRKAVPAPAAYIRALLRRFAPTEAMRAKLLAGTDIDEKRLADPGTDVTLFSFVTFSENLTRIVGQEWPMDAFSTWASAMQGALEVAVRSSATVGEGIATTAHYGHVRAPFLDIAVRRENAKTRLSLVPTVALSEPTRRAMSETAVFGACAMLVQLLEDAASELEVHFPWNPPSYVKRLVAMLPGPVKFVQPQCALLIPNELCDRPSPFADPTLHASAVAELDHFARRIKGEDMLIMRIERLFKRKRTGRLSEDDAAKELGLSRRTLVRRLAESGTTYRELLDANLKARATQMRETAKLSRTEMSEALGFEDPTSFSRACRRWFKE
jgi:AraC-like DNA-binding protein